MPCSRNGRRTGIASPQIAGSLFWFPDSRRLLTMSPGGIIVVDGDTGSSRLVGGAPGDRFLIGMSHDGRRVYFARSEVESDIWLADLTAPGAR
jgi:hypothetical protein